MVQIFRGVAVALLALVILPNVAKPWGGDGHRVVGAVADILIADHPATESKVNQILEGKSLSEVSVWMDCAKGFRYCNRALTAEELAYVARNPGHHAYHYTDVPFQQSTYQDNTAGTEADDVVHILQYAIDVLRGSARTDGPADLNQKEALWVIVHLVGDIHQPLHVGAAYFDQSCETEVDPNVTGVGRPDFGIGSVEVATTGGNDLKISTSRSLHSYWDSTTVSDAIALAKSEDQLPDRSLSAFAHDIVAKHEPNRWQMSGDPHAWPDAWATEILPLARMAITRVQVDDIASHSDDGHFLKCTWDISIPDGYGAWAGQQAMTQLGKAGFRLAALLEAIFEGTQ